MAAAAVVAALALGFNAPMAPQLQQPRLHAPLAPHRAAHLTMADPWSTGGGGSDTRIRPRHGPLARARKGTRQE